MRVLTGFLLCLVIVSTVAPPVDEAKKKAKQAGKDGHESASEENEIDQQAFDVEYKRYLQEVVQVLESDDEFKNRLTKADPNDIKSGKIARELEFVNHNVRSKLDELKRGELERLRQLAVQRYEMTNGIEKHHLRIPSHLDPRNPHTFEAEDLRKLIVQTTKELEETDKRRKEDFKEYEMRKELEYQEQLKHLDEKNREGARKQHEEMMEKHKKHPQLHHPGSKQQYEQVWEEQDHQEDQEFNPKTFFHLHDLDGNGVWDTNEVKALFKKELDKMYDPNAPEDDIRERFEEMERMREHVFNETDTDRDQLISYQEFLDQTKRQEFERDEGWEPLDQAAPVYNQEEYSNYAKNHEEEIRRMIDQGLIPPAPHGYVPMIVPPELQHHPDVQRMQQGAAGHHNIPPGMHPNEIPHGQGYPQGGQGYPQGGQGYPQGGQGHPQAGQGYPQGQPQYGQPQYQQPQYGQGSFQGGSPPQGQYQGSPQYHQPQYGQGQVNPNAQNAPIPPPQHINPQGQVQQPPQGVPPPQGHPPQQQQPAGSVQQQQQPSSSSTTHP